MSSGGMERQIIELLKGLKKRGNLTIHFGVMMRGGEREKEAANYTHKVLPFGQRCNFDFTPFFSLLKLAKKNNINLIHTFGCKSDFAGLAVSKIFNIPNINGSIRSARSKLILLDRLSRLCMPLSDWIVANSHAGLKAFGVNRYPHVSVIHNGLDLNRFKHIKPFIHNCPTICMVGNFTPKKDQKSLISALPIIHREIPNIKLILVGRGEKKLRECQRLVSSIGITSCTEFITNTNHPEPYIAGSQAGILISPQGEGISNVIMEYMALGKPVVASYKGGNSEIVENGRTGYLIPENTPKLIADAILKLFRNPEEAEQMGKLGRERITQKFNLDRMIDEYEILYHRLLKSN